MKILRLKYGLSYLATICSILYIGSAAAVSENKEQESHLPFNELSAFSKAYHEIKSNYVEPINDDVLIRAAIRGMVESLDKHSKYLSKKQFQSFMEANHGQYAGVGLIIRKKEYGVVVSKVVKNSPADEAGIKTGMMVIEVDGKPVDSLTHKKVSQMIRGEVGSIVELVVASPEYSTPKKCQLQRRLVILESIKSQLLPKSVGYVAISRFTFKSLEEFNDAVVDLSREQPLKKLILDLRNNPGGTLDTAVELCDLFVREGKIVISTGNSEDAKQTYHASERTPFENLDVVVVINGQSASASEILASALRDHDKAIILGENSYGKGSIQSIFPLNDGSGIKLTSAEYFSPLGHKIQDVGIKPDVVFKAPKEKNPHDIRLLDDPQLLQAYYILAK